MIDLQYIRQFFPQAVASNPSFDKQMLKEYMQLRILEHLSHTDYAKKIAFIGGTNLRLIRHIDRFSEDLDFDCHQLSEVEFMQMTDEIVEFLRLSGLKIETRDRKNNRLTAFRRNLYFPELLFELGLTGHREERFLIKIEAQDQGVAYQPQVQYVRGCGMFFPLQTPPDSVLCAMKIGALLTRHKGRDFYDTMFLLGQGIEPDYSFLEQRTGIANKAQLKQAFSDMMQTVDIQQKKNDFQHMLFNPTHNERISMFEAFINEW